jgi:hypothetical protein
MREKGRKKYCLSMLCINKLFVAYRRRCRNHTWAFFFETETSYPLDLSVARCPFYIKKDYAIKNICRFTKFQKGISKTKLQIQSSRSYGTIETNFFHPQQVVIQQMNTSSKQFFRTSFWKKFVLHFFVTSKVCIYCNDVRTLAVFRKPSRSQKQLFRWSFIAFTF